ncbi:MAG: FHA domain-containing protein, partial [Pseudomonadota bacterium]
ATVARVAAAISSAAKVASAIGASSAKAAGAIGAKAPGTGASSNAATNETPRPVASTKEGTPTGVSNGFMAPADRGGRYRGAANGMGAKDATVVTGRDGRPGDRAEPIAAAHLLAPADGARFGLIGGRMIIGRASVPGDSIDIDLSSLKRGTDRVSRRHAEIISQGGEYFIRDLGSLNGTYITGRGRLGRDQLYKLKDRDEIVLGGAKLEFRKG